MNIQSLINSSFGLESASMANNRRGVQQPTDAESIGLTGWGIETEKALGALIKSHTAKLNDGGLMDKSSQIKASANLLSSGIEKLVKKYAMESAVFHTLPADVKTALSIPANAVFNYKKELSSATDSDAKYIASYKLKQATAALESGLWSIFSGIEALSRAKSPLGVTLEGEKAYSSIAKTWTLPGAGYEHVMAGTESTGIATFSDQIYIPKVSAFNSWYNVPAVIMPKVQKSKTVLNEICEIPVSTKVMLAYERKPDGTVGTPFRREEIYAKMDMSETVPWLDEMRTRDLVLEEAEFGKVVDFHQTALANHNNKPFLAYNEHIGPQLNLISYSVDNGSGGVVDHDGFVPDTRSGVSEGPTLGQLDTKGKYLRVTPDKADPTKFYHVTLDWDVQNTALLVLFTPSDATMKAVKKCKFRANLRDLEQTLQSRVYWKIVEERTTLHTPEIDRFVVPILAEEMETLSERGSAGHLNKIVELTNETIQHKKESRWIREYRQMRSLLKSAKMDTTTGVYDSKILYVEKFIDLNTLGEIRKDESLAYHLGNNLSVIRDQFGKDANTQEGVQMSIFTGTLNLNVISQCLEHITGEVTENTDAKFLGIAQTDRVSAITLGKTKDAPIQSIVVGTDKTDFDAQGYKNNKPIPTTEIVYNFDIIPTFKDENIHTTVMIEQPTKVISGTEIRANENLAIPSMIIHAGFKFNKIRPAAASIAITGVGFRATSN